MGRGDQANKRTDSVRVRLSPDMMKRLEMVSAELGMPASTVAALAVGSYVNDHERTIIHDRILTDDGVIVSSRKTAIPEKQTS